MWATLKGGVFTCGLTLMLVSMIPTEVRAQNYCTAANPNDNAADDAALQDCLNGGGLIILTNGSPGYILREGLRLRLNGTVLSGNEYDRATLIAHPDLNGEMLRAEADYFELSYLKFDGNRFNRVYPCQYPLGHNIIVFGWGFVIRFINSDFARCGSALEVNGGGFAIYNNTFAWNGFSADERSGEWADGLTIHRCSGGSVTSNQMAENTDIGLVINEGANCTIRWNSIWNENQYAFAGFHVSAGGSGGDHSGGEYTNNTIWSGHDKVAFGLIVGAEQWHGTRTAHVGTVGWNYIEGAVINLAVDGVDAGSVIDNTMYNARGTRGLTACYGLPALDFAAAHNGAGLTLQPGWTFRTCH